MRPENLGPVSDEVLKVRSEVKVSINQTMEDLKEFIRSTVSSMIGATDPAHTLPPVEITVGDFTAGKGTATVGKNTVTIVCDPAMSLGRGDPIVAVPINPSLYYVVGKRR